MKDILVKKKINNLYHFTNINNLETIFSYGLLSRSALQDQNIKSYFNDSYRLDQCLDAVCMSIEFPNYKMFYKLRTQCKSIKWAVLEIDSTLLVKLKCAFCWNNAANSETSRIPIEDRLGKDSLLQLFYDKEGFPKRSELKIPVNYPTNPQAEVLVFENILPCYIKRVIVEDEFTKNLVITKLSKIPGNIPVIIDPSKFIGRTDYKFWQNQGD